MQQVFCFDLQSDLQFVVSRPAALFDTECDSCACKHEVWKQQGLFWNVQLDFASMRKMEKKIKEYQELAQKELHMQNCKYNWKARFKLFWAAKQFNRVESWSHNGS